MKILKTLLCITLVIASLSLCSCSDDVRKIMKKYGPESESSEQLSKNSEENTYYEYQYTENHTYEFFNENYESFDDNLIWSACAEYCISTAKASYAAIKDVPIDQFVACGAKTVCRPINSELDPLYDWTVNKIVIYWQRDSDLANYRNYGEDLVIAEEYVIQDKTLINELLEGIKNGKTSSETVETGQMSTAFIIDSESEERIYGLLSLRLYFEECETIYWDAPICISSEAVRYIHCRGRNVLLTDHLNGLVSDILNRW